MTTTQVVQLAEGWLEDVSMSNNLGGTWVGDYVEWGTQAPRWWWVPGFCTACHYYPCRCHASYWLQPFHVSGGPARVRLALDEVLALRAAAEKDAKLRAVLAKLTPAIEVEVSFG